MCVCACVLHYSLSEGKRTKLQVQCGRLYRQSVGASLSRNPILVVRSQLGTEYETLKVTWGIDGQGSRL